MTDNELREELAQKKSGSAISVGSPRSFNDMQSASQSSPKIKGEAAVKR